MLLNIEDVKDLYDLCPYKIGRIVENCGVQYRVIRTYKDDNVDIARVDNPTKMHFKIPTRILTLV